MTDIARLSKVIDFSFEAEGPEWIGDPGSDRAVARQGLKAFYGQAHWFTPLVGNGAMYFGTVNFTEDGLRTEEGDHPCGTVACLAGNAVLLFAPAGTKVYPRNSTVLLPNARQRHICDYAASLLDLKPDDALLLFNGGISPGGIRKFAAGLIEAEESRMLAPGRRGRRD